jgi:hypothetical protein
MTRITPNLWFDTADLEAAVVGAAADGTPR